MTARHADFGYERLTPGEKSERVQRVFTSVSGRYDLMNDLMSFGLHRLWKRFAVHLSGVSRGACVLDLAGGTGDCARLYRRAVGPDGSVVVCDANAAMLARGRDRLLDDGLHEGMAFAQAGAEALPFRDECFDCVNVAFGLRNFTGKAAALETMLRILKFGAVLIVLEFSRPAAAILRRIYDAYSFNVIPALGGVVAKDRDSYRYLVESIRVHPDQEALKLQMEEAGFSRVEFFNLSGGIVAIHRGYRI